MLFLGNSPPFETCNLSITSYTQDLAIQIIRLVMTNLPLQGTSPVTTETKLYHT